MGEIIGEVIAGAVALAILIAAILIVVVWILDTDWTHEFRSIPFRLSARWADVKSTVEVCLVIFVIGLLIHIPFRLWAGNELSFSAFIATIAGLAVSLAFIFIVFCLGHLFMGLFQTDTSAPGLEIVHTQLIHGDQGLAKEVLVHAALNDQSMRDEPEPEFDD
jgi:hypothetical protein